MLAGAGADGRQFAGATVATEQWGQGRGHAGTSKGISQSPQMRCAAGRAHALSPQSGHVYFVLLAFFPRL